MNAIEQRLEAELNELDAKLEALEQKYRDEVKDIKKEVTAKRQAYELVKEALNVEREKDKKREEAFATLICQAGDGITQSDLLQFSRDSEIDHGGLITIDTEPAQDDRGTAQNEEVPVSAAVANI